jgi:hypothetical protein
MASTSYAQRPCHEPLFEINPLTAATIEVFYSDRTLETFGRGGAGWFGRRANVDVHQMARLRGRSLRAYASYRNAMSNPVSTIAVDDVQHGWPTTLIRTQCGHGILWNFVDLG